MTTRRITTYICDACGKELEKKREITRFVSYRVGDRTEVQASDLCSECVDRFVKSLDGFGFDVSEWIEAVAA